MEDNLQSIINKLTNNIFIIASILESKESFNTTREEVYEYLRQGFEVKEIRTCPVYFKFKDIPGAIIYKLELRHFLTNLILWEPLIKLGYQDKIDETYIVDCTQISTKNIKKYIDNKIILPFRINISNQKLNKVCSDIIHNLAKVSTDFNIILGMSINIETFIDVANRHPRFNEIIHTKVDENKQPNEIEAELNSLMHEEIDILVNDPEPNLLKFILRSGTGIKDKQLTEFSINGGMKPDLYGNTIPIPINSNFVVGGLGNIPNYYIDSLGGRKSVIMNKLVMGRSGHFAKMVMLLTSQIRMRKDDHVCNTLHPILYEIKSKSHLSRLVGRYYRTMNSRTYSVINGSEKELIGQKIYVKSPITCASREGICKECYGDLYYTNKDINIGAFAGSRITEPLSQNVLSSKHLLTTISQPIKFTNDFYKFFTLSANEIIPNTIDDDIDLNDYSLLIIHENIITINEFDENDYNNLLTIFHVKNKKTNEIFEIRELDGKDMYIGPDLMEMINKEKNPKEYYEIDFSKIEDDTKLFVLEVENNELTKPLYNIMELLNKGDHFNATSVDDMAQFLLDLLIESNISSQAVHGELIINPIIRSAQDILKRPNFSAYSNKAQYQILTLEAALEKHPSVLISLSFQALGRQLINPLTFRKTEGSFIDPFYRERP